MAPMVLNIGRCSHGLPRRRVIGAENRGNRGGAKSNGGHIKSGDTIRISRAFALVYVSRYLPRHLCAQPPIRTSVHPAPEGIPTSLPRCPPDGGPQLAWLSPLRFIFYIHTHSDGADNIVFYNPSTEQSTDSYVEIEWEALVEDALPEMEFCLTFQTSVHTRLSPLR